MIFTAVSSKITCDMTILSRAIWLWWISLPTLCGLLRIMWNIQVWIDSRKCATCRIKKAEASIFFNHDNQLVTRVHPACTYMQFIRFTLCYAGVLSLFLSLILILSYVLIPRSLMTTRFFGRPLWGRWRFLECSATRISWASQKPLEEKVRKFYIYFISISILRCSTEHLNSWVC